MTVLAVNVMGNYNNKNYESKVIEIEYEPKRTLLKEIRDKIGAPMSGITFNQYYKLGYFRFSDNKLPYIIKSNGKIEFCSNIDETLLSEFLETHKIENNMIEVEYGFPQAGGPDVMEWLKLWKIAWKAIEVISTIGGAIGFIELIKSKFNKKEPLPHEMMECLYKREYWNHHELAKKLDISPEEAKVLLKTFGFVWNQSKKIYVIDEIKKKQIEGIIYKIKFLDE